MNNGNPALLEKLRNVTLFIMDVDGTLTDGSLYYSPEGHTFKRFHVRDGMGIVLLHRAGIRTAIITSENNAIVTTRAEKLGINHVITGSRNKLRSLQDLTASLHCSVKECSFIGDDVNDEAPVRLCGVSACPSDATPHIRSMVDYVCQARGGEGAVREFAELVLQAQGKMITLPDEW